MPELHLGFSFHSLVILPAAIVAFLFAFALYRTTVPLLSVRLRVILGALRWFGLFFLFVAVGEPILSLVTRNTEQPAILVLVDNSKSMTIRDRLGDRRQSLQNILTSQSFKRLSSLGLLHYGSFDVTTRFSESFSTDSLALIGDGTDIARALSQSRERIASQNVQAVLLISDGNSTTGSHPLYEAVELGIPVFTIGVGDTSEQKDLLVRRALTNSITYVGNRVPVNTTIKSVGYGGERVEVTLSDDQQVLDRRFLTLEPGMRDYPLNFSFVPETEGVIKLTVAVSPLPGELTTHNNRFVIFTKALKSKMRVLLIAGAPNPDVAAIRRILDQDPNIEVTTRVQRRDGSFYEGPLTAQTLEKAECLIVVGFPTAVTSPQLVQQIVSNTREKGLFLLLGRNVDFTRLRLLEPVLPVSLSAGSSEEIQAFISIPDIRAAHPIMKTAKTSPDGWAKLPPIFKLQTQFILRPESQVLGVTRFQTTLTNDPFLVSRSIARQKSLMLLGYGAWRWKLLSDEGTAELLDEFVGNALRWLTAREDENRIRVRTSKEFFSGQESVEFIGQVYDESLQPITNAQIAVSIRNSKRIFEITLDPMGNGQYAGELDGLEEGDYRFTATVRRNANVMHEERGSFSVGSLNLEFLETRMNKPLLEQLSSRTGGTYYDAISHNELPNDVAALSNFQPRELIRAEELQLWNSPWLLSLILSLFALEWLLRKRNGLL